MIELANVIVVSVLGLEVSTGVPMCDSIFQKRDDTRFLKHTLAYDSSDGPRIEFSDVKITRWQPEERKY